MLKRCLLIMLIVCAGCIIKLNLGSKANAVRNENYEEISESSASCEEGRQYLQNLEDLDTEKIEKEIKQEERKEKVKEITDSDGNVDFKKYFKDSIFIGDSITEYISAAEILPESNVYGKKGKTLLGVKEDIERLRYSKPERVIILFGMNDVVNFASAEEFENKYIEFVNKIKETTPDTKIYIESPTPVQAKAENTEKGLNNYNLNKFRQAAMEAADKTGVTYVDITVLINSDEYFEPDGIHFKYNFYEPLFKYLKNIIEETEKD